MLKSIFVTILLLFATNLVSASPVSEIRNFNVTSLDEILHIEKGFTATSTAWSPDGQNLLVTYSKWIPPSKNIVKHYLLDTNSHVFREIDYGINESDTNGIMAAKWTPSGDKIYFGVSRFDPTNSGNCFIICNPDGTNMRCVGTNFTNLSNIVDNFGSIGYQRNLKWSPDSSKIVFEWEKPGNNFTGVYVANGNGTNAHELPSRASTRDSEPIWYDSDKILLATNEGTVALINEINEMIQTFQPENKDKIYWAFSLSPDKKKIIFASGSPPSGSPGNRLHTCISNIDGSNLKGNISHDENLWESESWQPNGSLLLVNQKGILYIIEGKENYKHPLYKGNASEPQWFPDGKRILFVENENKLYSIEIDGTNLSYITNFGLTSSYFWNLLDWNPFEKNKKISISPSGDIIVFTSALYPDTGKIIENEPGPSKCQNIAAPLFIVNSNGSNSIRLTPSIKGKHEIFKEWSSNGKQFTIGSILFSSDSDWDYGESSLVELNPGNFSSVWKSLPVKKILENEGPSTTYKIQSNKSSSTNTSQATENQNCAGAPRCKQRGMSAPALSITAFYLKSIILICLYACFSSSFP
jgi:Tol biopolymer transport system component